jgi:uncharacterized protein (TIGR02118 family)
MLRNGVASGAGTDLPQKGTHPMLKVYILSRRRSDMTHEQYVAHWRDKHAPLFSSQPDTKRYVRRYIQSRVTGDRPDGPVLGDVDGIVQLWFDDIDGFNAFAGSASYQDVIRPDEEDLLIHNAANTSSRKSIQSSNRLRNPIPGENVVVAWPSRAVCIRRSA